MPPRNQLLTHHGWFQTRSASPAVPQRWTPSTGPSRRGWPPPGGRGNQPLRRQVDCWPPRQMEASLGSHCGPFVVALPKLTVRVLHCAHPRRCLPLHPETAGRWPAAKTRSLASSVGELLGKPIVSVTNHDVSVVGFVVA